MSLCQVNKIWLFLVICTSCLLNVASHPESQNFPMDSSELWVRPGMIWALRACSGNWERAS